MNGIKEKVKNILKKLHSISDLRIYLAVSIFIFALDRISKILVTHIMIPGQRKIVIDGFLGFSYIYNPGAAFGILRDMDSTLRYILFAVVSVIAIIVIIYYLFTIPLKEKATLLSLSIIFGGAMGNFLDRIFSGEVLDFIYTTFWPTFNLADAAISIGVVILIFKTIFPGKKQEGSNIPEAVDIDNRGEQ